MCYDGNVRISTWNSAALFCNDIPKYRARLRFAEKVLERSDVCGFQETHDDGTSDRDYLDYRCHRSFRSFPSYLNGAAGGILIMIRLTYLVLWDRSIPHEIIPGRVLAVELLHAEVSFMFLCERHKMKLICAILFCLEK